MMEEVNSRIISEGGRVIAQEESVMRVSQLGDHVGTLEIEVRPAGVGEQSLQDALDEITTLRDRIAWLERELVEARR
jgi:hypothetical protein